MHLFDIVYMLTYFIINFVKLDKIELTKLKRATCIFTEEVSISNYYAQVDMFSPKKKQRNIH